MRPRFTGLLLLLASCAAEPLQPAVSTLESTPLSTVSTIRPVEENCREYAVPITVGGKEEIAYGKACQQPDGTWQIVQAPGGPEGAPNVLQPTIIYPAYPYYYDPWWGPPWWGPPWWGPPFGFAGFFGFGVGFHHHHHHRHHHH
jgi:hypothetical protein